MSRNEASESQVHSKPKMEEMDPDTTCGFGSFRPRWLQGLATPKLFLLLYSLLGTLSGTYYTYRIGVVSTLEKRFAFNSKVSGLIMMVDEVTPIFLGVPVGHWAANAHRPRAVSTGMLLVALCCFISATPYFLYGSRTGAELERLAAANRSIASVVWANESRSDFKGVEHCGAGSAGCEEDSRPPTVAVVLLFLLAGFLKGFGNIAYHVIGLAYMDDIAKKRNSPLYLAATYSLRLFGPVLGYLMSSAFLKYYENPLEDPGYGPEDPRWIGGWWMGFLVEGALLVIFSLLLALFPRNMSEKQVSIPKQEPEKRTPVFDFPGLLLSLKRLSTNTVFLLIVLRTIMAIGNIGHYMMLPKYMEHQFKMSASDASLYSGPPGLIAVMSSMVAGGYLLWRFQPGPRALTAALIVLELVAAVGPLLLILPTCPEDSVGQFGTQPDGLLQLIGECNALCNCTTAEFSPVCGSDGSTVFFSPCHAGCTYNTTQGYGGCSCDPNGEVTVGRCAVGNCWSQALIYIVSLPILQFVTSLLAVSYTMLLFRSIDQRDKSIAIGFLETFICLFGFLPFLAGFSALIDSACLVWEESCGGRGNCWLYNVPAFNHLMHGSSALFSLLTALCMCGVFLKAHAIPNLYGEEDEEKKKATDVQLEKL